MRYIPLLILLAAAGIAEPAFARQGEDSGRSRCREVCGYVNVTRCDKRGMNCVVVREYFCRRVCR